MNSMIPSFLAKPAFKFYQRRIRKDPFHCAIAQWKRDRGEQELKFNFPLTSESVVLDVGGFRGDFAHEVFSRFGCKVLVFEPMPEFYDQCVKRFRDNPNVRVLRYGLGEVDERLPLSEANDASSFFRGDADSGSVSAEVRDVKSVWDELQIRDVALMKINIEGSEYPLLDRLIESGLSTHVDHLLVQFHDFVDDASERRAVIQRRLGPSHEQSWCYDFVWESWQRRPLAQVA